MESLLKILNKAGMSAKQSKDFDFNDVEKMKVDAFNSLNGNENERDGFWCAECRNKGCIMELREKPGGRMFAITKECKCMETRRSIRKMQKSGLKDVIKKCTFSNFEEIEPWQMTMKKRAIEYAKRKEGWFLLAGQSGSGKTMLCTAICREFLLKGIAVAYMAWREDISVLKAVSMDAEKREEMMHRFKTSPVLYIDDFFKTGKKPDGGKAEPTEAEQKLAFEIINYRYNNPELITIISTEWSAKELLRIETATAGRILEKAGDNALYIAPDMSRNYRLKGVISL